MLITPEAFDIQSDEGGGARMPDDPNAALVLFRVDVSQDGESTMLALAGEFDLAAVDEVRARFAEARDSGAAQVVIDLRELTFVDSTGIAFLLSAAKADQDGRLSFIPCESQAVQRVFAVTGVTELFGGAGGSRS